MGREVYLDRNRRAPVRAVTELAVIILTPRPDRPVLFQRNRMRLASRDLDHPLHDLAHFRRNRHERGRCRHTISGRPDGAVFFQVQLMELAQSDRPDVIDGVQFRGNQFGRIEAIGLPDIVFPRIPDRPVIGQQIGFPPARGDLDDFAVLKRFHIDPDGFDAFSGVASPQCTALVVPPMPIRYRLFS